MYKNELENLLRTNAVPNFILLRSPEAFLNEMYAKEILASWGVESVYKIFDGEYEFGSASEFLTPSLFSSKNALYIKSEKFIPTKEIKTLINLCKNSPDNYLIYEFLESDIRVNNDFIKAFEKNFVRFFSPNNPNEAVQILSFYCQILGLRPNGVALLEIYKIHNNNLSLSASELDKFHLLELELSLENVRANVSGLSEISFEDLFKKLINLQDFRDDFFAFIQSSGYNESELISYLYTNIFRIFQIHSFIKINGTLNFKEILGYQPPIQVQNELRALALKFSVVQFKEMFQTLNEIEFSLKTKSNIDKTYFLLSGLLEFQRVISKKR